MSASNVDDIYELSPLQQGMLWHSAHDGAADMYLMQDTHLADGPLDTDALVQAANAVMRVHTALRTSFHWDGQDKPLQVVHRDVTLPVRRHDWSGLDEQQQRERINQLQVEDRTAGFNVTAPPLQRLNLIRLGDDRHCLIWTFHHLLFDGWSVPVFLGDVLGQYRSLTVGGPPPQPAPPFRDYIAWLQSRDLAVAKTFWTDCLAGVTPNQLAPLKPWDPQRGTGPVDSRTVRLPVPLATALRELAARQRVTLGTVVQAAWAILLRVYTGDDDVTFGSISAGRPTELPRVERMIGQFANTLPTRFTVPADGDLGSWLRDVQGEFAQMRRYEYTPLADIKKWAGSSGRQLFDSAVVMNNYTLPVDTEGIAERLTFRMDGSYGKINYPLVASFVPEPASELHVSLHRERFDPGFIDDVLTRMNTIFTAMTTADRVATVVAATGPATAPTTTRPDIPNPTAGTGGAGSMPTTTLEEKIAAVYGEILGTGEVDVTTSFFELGGDSFDAVRAVGRIEGASVGMLAANPSVRDLAAALAPTTGPDLALDDEITELERQLAAKRAEKAQQAGPDRLVPAPRDGAMLCTYQQEGMWFLQQLDPSWAGYHIYTALRLHGSLDVPALERALHALVVRHEVLRTRFVNHGGLPRQVVDPPPEAMSLPVTDLTADQVRKWATDVYAQPFDLAREPGLRVAVARLTPNEHATVLVLHHIITDGWSPQVMFGDLSTLYAAEIAGSGAKLPPLHLQPADFAAWHRRWLSGAEMERLIGYWRDTLTGLSTIDFPTDRPRPAQPTFAGARVQRQLPTEVASAAHTYARTHRVSLLAVLQAALLTVLHRYTGQHDLPIGSLVSGRTRPEIEPMVGYFGNTVVLRTGLGGDPTFAELVHRCHNTVQGAITHQDAPFHLVVEALRPERVAGRNPLFQIALNLHPLGIANNNSTLPGITFDAIEVDGDSSLFDFEVDIADRPDGNLDLSIEYSTELFNADRIDRLADHYLAALAGGLTAPDTPACDIEIMTTTERHQVRPAFGAGTEPVRRAELPHRMVDAVAARTPDAVAVVDHDGAMLTYRQLDVAANQLAHRLRRLGVKPGVRVGICLRRGGDLVTALLATWKAGGAHVPLDPDLPAPVPAVVVTHAEHAPMFDSALVLDAERAALAAEPITAPDGAATLDDPACVLHTSGSTGAPKGVLVPHRAVHHQLAWLQDTYGLRPADRVLQRTPIGFVGSVLELFWPLSTGATLVLAAPGHHNDPEHLHRLIAGHRVTTMHLPPTMLGAFLDSDVSTRDPGALGSLCRILASGEALPVEIMHRFRTALPDATLHHLYGAAEAGTVTAWHCEPDATVAPIGRPVADMRTYVLDAELRPVPVGVPGQLFVAGAGLAHGYVDRPALTAARFLPDPHGDRPGERMYATGDLVRWRSDGLLEYLGRAGSRGRRTELSEVERVIAHHPKIRQCAVLPRDNGVVAYLVGDPDTAELRRYLTDRLPTAMIPAALVTLPRLPLTPHGTLDASRLPEPTPPTSGHAPHAGTERWLAAIWQSLLGTERIHADDSFFDLGGNSLQTTQLVARVREARNIHLDLRHVFSNPTLERLAARLDATTPARLSNV